MKQLVLNTFPILKTFTQEKLIKSRFFNNLGLQVFRMKLAQSRYESRKYVINETYEKDIITFKEDGILQKNNFLDAASFTDIEKECQEILHKGEFKKHGRKDGPNMIYMLDVFSLDLSQYPAISDLLNNKHLNELFSAMERRTINIANKDIIVQFQYLVQGENDGSEDPETQLHADTFFNTHKAWLYINDVKLANGPFVFVPKTHHIYLDGRLGKEKEFSKNIKSKGSRRVSSEELADIGLEEKVYTCNKNTLVMANTLGYHRRLKGASGNDRITIAFSARSNPFL